MHKAHRVLLDSRVHKVPKAHRVLLVFRECRELRARKEPKAQ